MKENNIDSSDKNVLNQWIGVFLFAVAFAWVESAVVVYLRRIYFQGSFYFPIIVHWEDGSLVGDRLMLIEFGREIATIIMLSAVAFVSAKDRLRQLCFFMIAFGFWDIFYYIWLKVMVNWPESLMTWDLLFFIPLPWVGPVITPLLIAVTMVIAGTLIIYAQEKGFTTIFFWYDWVIEYGCALMMIVAFCWDWKNIMRLPDGVVRTGIPNPFAWGLFIPAYLIACCYFAYRFIQIMKSRRRQNDKPIRQTDT